ncbi:MAG TPA: XrtA system polysaccharide chain length determinant [Acetobacteraceae bacterium]|nr:XrtA system polysaccharide chain length determinant [Acetobacteraceae bacterium]
MEFMRALLQKHLKAAWRRRWIGVAAAWAVCIAGWSLVAALPNQYEASSELFVDTNAILTPLLAGIAVNTSPQGQLEMLQRTLLSRPNIETLISKTNLDLSVSGPLARDALVRRLQSSIALGQEGADLFTIAFKSPHPELAQRVVQSLLSIFVERATGTNHRQMENARHFLEHQIASYEQQLRSVERRQAEFRSKYMGEFTPQGGGVDAALGTLEGNVAQLTAVVQDRTLEAGALQKELAATKPMLAADALAAQGDGNGPLAQAEERLRFMKLQYTDDFPGVIALKRQIEAMKTAQSGAAGGGRAVAAGKTGGGGRLVPNPVYDQLKVKLLLVQGQITAMTRKLAAVRADITRLQTFRRQEPNLVTEYDSMNRDYGVLQQNYDALLGRLQSANIAEAADTQANKVQIQIIEPPVVPRLPVAPNRLLLVTGVLMAGLGAAVGLPILLAQLDRSFAEVDDLRILGLPVLGGISLLGTRPLRQTIRVALPIGLAFIVLFAIYGGLLVHILHTTAVI